MKKSELTVGGRYVDRIGAEYMYLGDVPKGLPVEYWMDSWHKSTRAGKPSECAAAQLYGVGNDGAEDWQPKVIGVNRLVEPAEARDARVRANNGESRKAQAYAARLESALAKAGLPRAAVIAGYKGGDHPGFKFTPAMAQVRLNGPEAETLLRLAGVLG